MLSRERDGANDDNKIKGRRAGGGGVLVDKAGVFEYYYFVGSHRQMGMKGDLIVNKSAVFRVAGRAKIDVEFVEGATLLAKTRISRMARICPSRICMPRWPVIRGDVRRVCGAFTWPTAVRLDGFVDGDYRAYGGQETTNPISPARYEKGDQIGRIRVFNPGHLPLDRVMRPEAYVYLFEPEPISSYLRLQLSNQSEVENLRLLEEFGFQRERVSARGEIRPALVWSLGECAVAGADAWEISDECLVVGVDEWQIAVVNVPQLVPSVEAVVSGRLIRELSARVEWLDGEVGEQYLV